MHNCMYKWSLFLNSGKDPLLLFYPHPANRTEPNLSDLSRAFCNLGVDLDDLSEFLEEVESSPLEQKVPLFPVPRVSSHVYVGPGSFGETSKRRSRAPSLSSEEEDCYDHIPPYLPPLPTAEGEEGKGNVIVFEFHFGVLV